MVMGYYTNYELKCDPPINVERILTFLTIKRCCDHEGISLPPEAEKCLNSESGKFLIAALENEELIFALGRGLDGGEKAKWYEHEKDMRELSKLAPSILFTLSGEGEESSDAWKKYFKNGLCQVTRAEIKLEEFDESKLK